MERIKIVISEALRFLLHIFCIFPIKENRVIFNSYMGRQYSCNPKYISEYLETRYKGKFDIVWCFVDPEKYAFLRDRGIRLCKVRTLPFYYYRMTSKVFVCNGTFGAEVPKRRGQYSINTWHGGGGGYKKMGDDVKQHRGVNTVRSDIEKKGVDLYCASSETSLQNTVRRALHHNGDYLGGTPRNDMFINLDRPDIRSEVYRSLGIDASAHLALYAPTFREFGDRGSGVHDYGLDFLRLHEALEKRFGGRWIVAIRYHYYITDYTIPDSEYVVDATKYPDMQDLLYAADTMITDYSSSIWDYSFTNKPCFLFCSDLSDYNVSRGFNKPIRQWGFPVAETNDELYNAILNWNEEEHRANMQRHHEENGSFEDGTATERICRIIAQKCGLK